MAHEYQPEEHKSRREVLSAIRKVDCLSDLLLTVDDRPDEFVYELDLEVIVYGRTYHHKPVGPYLKLLTYAGGETIIKEGEWADNYYYIVVEGHVEVFRLNSRGKEREVSRLSAGEQFGARAMLAGSRRPVSVKAPQKQSVQVLKVHRPALRLLRKISTFDDKFEETFQSHGVKAAIDDLMAKTALSSELKSELVNASSFKALAKHHILFEQATANTALFLIIEGWVRRTREEHGRQERDYLGKGYCLGLEEGTSSYLYTATALSRMEVLEISLQPGLNPDFNKALITALKQFAAPVMEEAVENYQPPVRDKILEAQQGLISAGLVDANNLLVMDMDLCVRCGNCSMACHKVHGQSRLMRRGVHITRIEPSKQRSFKSLLAPSACMHCSDPECLLGCPTGAISRFKGGQIDIDSDTCIGCGDCATQCPYDAIFMVNREVSMPPPLNFKTRVLRNLAGLGEPEAPSVDLAKDMRAVKCNLCSDRKKLNPEGSKPNVYSCEENCPTGALARITPDNYFWEIARIKNLTMLDQGHAYGRNIHKADPPKRWIHAVCIAVFLFVAAGTILGLHSYGYGQGVWGVLNMRWATGLGGLLGVAGASSYHWRRAIYDRRRWPLRYWMLIHSYLGVIACFVVLLHGGTFSGGWLTKVLMISFDVVIFTGLFGLACYQIIPRVLTRIEGAPLLLEDLTGRRLELQREFSQIISKSPEHLKLLLETSAPQRFDSFRAVLHVLSQESLSQLLALTAKRSQVIAEQLKDERERGMFNEAMQTAALLPRVNALIFLHRLLKIWIAPHMAFAYLMVALMMVHIFQVFYALW